MLTGRSTTAPAGASGRIRRVAAAALCLLLAAGPARAASGKGDYLGVWSVTAGLGYAVPNTDEYANARAWRAAVGFSPMPNVEVDLEFGRFATGVSQPEADGIPTHTVASGSLEVRPVCLTAQYRTPLPELLSTATFSAGVGYYFIDYAMADRAREAFRATGRPGLPDQSVDDAWGLHLGAGLEYAFTERLSLFGEGRYLFLAPRTRGTGSGDFRFEGTLDLNTWIFAGGVKVVF